MNDFKGRERLDDIPPILRWILVAIKEVGFPVAVAVYMGYMQIKIMPQMAQALDANTETMKVLAQTMEKHSHQSEKAFRRILGTKYPDD